eukprot:TRINITY_DN8934_c1_g2_i1.p1 TRINITY_DN8934_c1_g2~~TRINITY_DN8934_c1_g2_i1.p1  ORF type:complete len:1024 (+),score=206.23 TRINITY_DN8934_c1_g2_i1:169-3240(+)
MTAADDDASILFFYLLVGLVSAIGLLGVSDRPLGTYVVLFIEGVVLGLLHFNEVDLAGLSRSIDAWTALDPYLRFAALLPCLLVSDATRLKWEYLRGSFKQWLVLTGPALILVSSGLAVLAKVALPYEWGWCTCLCFGSMLAPVDHRALREALRGTGVPQEFSSLLAVEGLIGGSAAMTLWAVALHDLGSGGSGAAWNVGGFVVCVLKWAAVSFVAGVVLGIVAVVCFIVATSPPKDFIGRWQLSILLVCAYAGAYMGLVHFNGCGAVATLLVGLFVSKWGWKHIPDRRAFTTIWETAAFVGNAVVFLLAGTMFAAACVGERSTVQAVDIGYMLLVYVSLVVLRGFALVLFYPCVRRTGFSTNRREILIMMIGNLKGSMTLLMAMTVYGDRRMSASTANLFMFHSCGCVFLLLCINGSRLHWLLRKLGMLGLSVARQEVLKRYKLALDKHIVACYDARTDASQGQRNVNRFLLGSWIAAIRAANQDAKSAERQAKRRMTDQLVEKLEQVQLTQSETLRRARSLPMDCFRSADRLSDRERPESRAASEAADLPRFGKLSSFTDVESPRVPSRDSKTCNEPLVEAGVLQSMLPSEGLRLSKGKGSPVSPAASDVSGWQRASVADYARWSYNARAHDPKRAAAAFAGEVERLSPQLEEEGDETALTRGLSEARLLFYALLRSQYQQDSEEGKLLQTSPSVGMLLECVSYGECHSFHWICDLTRLLRLLTFGVGSHTALSARLKRWLRHCRDGAIFGTDCMPVRRGNAVFDVYTVVCLIDAHEAAQKKLLSFASDDGLISDSMQVLLRAVVAESKQEVEFAKQFLSMNRVSSDLLKTVRTQQVALAVLHSAEALVRSWTTSGQVREEEVNYLLSSVREGRSAAMAPERPASEAGEKIGDWWHAREADLPLHLPEEAGDLRMNPLHHGDFRLLQYEAVCKQREEQAEQELLTEQQAQQDPEPAGPPPPSAFKYKGTSERLMPGSSVAHPSIDTLDTASPKKRGSSPPPRPIVDTLDTASPKKGSYSQM